MEIYQQNPQFQFAQELCAELHRQGYIAYLAGGCVRDMILGIEPRDFDLATDAQPEQVEKMFPKTIAVGKSFGVINVLDPTGQIEVEIATFRQDGNYQDGRRPDQVSFSTPQEDAKRRDLTINALFYDLNNKQIIDFCGGQQDIQNRLIRTVGEPEKRFQEDHLRILRAVRFISQLDFTIEDETWHAIIDQRKSLSTVSGERVQDEIEKLLVGKAVNKGLKALWQSQVLEQLIGFQVPWVDPEKIFQRKQSSDEDLWFRFFFWIFQAAELGGQRKLLIKDFEQWCDQWKFSRRLKQKTLTSLYWLLHNSFLKKTSLGELLELSYEAENRRAWDEYEVFYATESEKKLFADLKRRRQELGAEKPKPAVQAKDLITFVKGPELGKALSWCYWQQLEGKADTLQVLLEMWKEKHGKGH